MRAAVLRGRHITVEELPDPEPGPGQLVVAPVAAGICGSDLHMVAAMGERADADPVGTPGIVLGHEFAGTVVDIGDGTETDLAPGDRVTALPFTHGVAGPETIGLSPAHTGAMAERLIVDAVRTFRLPESVDLRLGALTEPLAVALHALKNAHGTGPIVVIGCGPIGLALIIAARHAGRHPIVAVDPVESRRVAADHLGADLVAEPGPPVIELVQTLGYAPAPISPLLDHDPPRVTVFEAVGRPDVVRTAIEQTPPHGRVVLAGACPHRVDVNPLALTLAEISVHTSFAYRATDFVHALRLLATDGDVVQQLITNELPLPRLGEALDALASDPSEVKVLIRP